MFLLWKIIGRKQEISCKNISLVPWYNMVESFGVLLNIDILELYLKYLVFKS